MRALKVGDTIGKQVGRARHRRGWTQQRLSDAVREHDESSTLGRGAIAKIESGDRKVSVDDWVLLAAALNVPPPLLLVPLGSEDAVEITPRSRIHPHLALEWLSGAECLTSSRQRVIRRGEWLAGAEPLRLWRNLRSVQDDLGRAVAWVQRAQYTGDAEQKRKAKSAHVEALEALHAHLLRMQTAGERPPGMNRQTLADMETVGLDVAGLAVWDPEQEDE
jgi:transcriptional regulator with XRE-family HTH domain